MIVNSLLVRYQGGFIVVEDAPSIATYGRRRGYLELGQVESEAEAQTIGTSEIERLRDPLQRVTIDADPRASATADRPYVGWNLGDYASTFDEDGNPDSARVREISVTQDDESGELKVVPKLASRLEELDARVQRTIRRRLSGTLEGRSASAGTAPPADSVRVRKANKETETFNWSGTVSDLVDEVNGPKQWNLDGRWAAVKYTWRTTPDVDATMRILLNGATYADHTLPANTETHYVFPGVEITRTQRWDMVVTSVDDVAEGLTAEWTVVYWDA